MNVGDCSKPVIGLMGGVGSGKSAVASRLARRGCAVIDADALARAALQTPQARRKLRAMWGPKLFDETGRVDRRKLAESVFDDPEALKRLESLIHPMVHAERERLREAARADPSVRAIVEDCPLLVETGIDRECDVLVFVEAGDATRRRRVLERRGWDEATWRQREARQTPLDIKHDLADHVVRNEGSSQQLDEQVDELLSTICQT